MSSKFFSSRKESQSTKENNRNAKSARTNVKRTNQPRKTGRGR